MRRPAMTKAQRQHAREQRALLRLRRAAVIYSVLGDEGADLSIAFASLTAACDVYRVAVGEREAKKMAREHLKELRAHAGGEP